MTKNHYIQPKGVKVLRSPQRCSEGHLVTIWPCIECAAAQARREAQCKRLPLRLRERIEP